MDEGTQPAAAVGVRRSKFVFWQHGLVLVLRPMGTSASLCYYSRSMLPFDSARLHFRPLTAADTAGMFALDSDPAVHRYLGGIGGQMVQPAQSAADHSPTSKPNMPPSALGAGPWCCAKPASLWAGPG